MAKSDRTGKRKPREAFRTRVPDLGYYFIVTDTKETMEVCSVTWMEKSFIEMSGPCPGA